jgi:hypothetical protein
MRGLQQVDKSLTSLNRVSRLTFIGGGNATRHES